MQENIGAIDLGTNSARLMIGRVDDSGTIERLLVQRRITRLGGGFSKDRGISPEAAERTMVAMDDFSVVLEKYGIQRYRAVATSAVRDAVNGKKFVAEVGEKTGIALEIIDGTEEALLTLRGVISGLDDRSGDFLIYDTGGGSTEYTVVTEEGSLFTRSLPLGVVRLTEGKENQAAMEEKIMRELSVLVGEIRSAGLMEKMAKATLVGTAGTATTLASIHLKMVDYDYRRVNNYQLSLHDVKKIYHYLLPMSPEERLKTPGLEKGREDLIVAGCLITISTMEMFGFHRLKVSDCGLLEGVLFSAHRR